MQRLPLRVGPFEVNCQILAFGDAAWIIDPGHDGERLAAELSRRALTPRLILLTHAHFDHIGAIPELQRRYPGLPVLVHPEDAKMFTHPLNAYPPAYPPISRPENVRDCRELAEEGLRVIETPGHTPGGCSYYFPAEKLLFTGDTLFAGSVGRTDLPGGDMGLLSRSLELLATLDDDTCVVPGHGPETTIAAEKRANPYL